MATNFRSSFSANTSTGAAGNRSYIKPPSSFYVFQPRPAVPSNFPNAAEFDGKRLRKAVARKTVDYNSSVVKMLETRLWRRDYRDGRAIQPDLAYYTQILPPMQMLENSSNCITTKFVRTSTNKMRCPIFCVLWTPEGRRLVTGASSGEFTLWNGLTFNFETILQAHDSAVKVMVWSHSDSWMVTADQTGYVKYWQSNMNNVKMFQAHKESVRAISFCPTDSKFATCSDDGTIRIWDFLRCHEERILRGHGADVKGVDWHPIKALIASGSKDSQQPVKLWDPKSGQSLATLHAHKNTVTDVKWNKNGNWLLTASRDHLIKIFDIRNMSSELQSFRGHKKEVSCLSWHPIHEGLFASGGSDGSILFWNVGTEKEIGGMEQAHDSIVWSLSWHPLGHILTSGSNDHSCKFWTRNRPGDKMRDKYNLNLLPKDLEEAEYEDDITSHVIPGMGFGERGSQEDEDIVIQIPGFGFDRPDEDTSNEPSGAHRYTSYGQSSKERKVPFSKPIPKQFQQQWNSEPKTKRRNEAHFPQGFDNFGNFPPTPPPPPPPPALSQSQQQNQLPFGDNGPNGPSQFPPPLPVPPPLFAPPFGNGNNNHNNNINNNNNGNNPTILPNSNQMFNDFIPNNNFPPNSGGGHVQPYPFNNGGNGGATNEGGGGNFMQQQPQQQFASESNSGYLPPPGYINEAHDRPPHHYEQQNYPSQSKRVHG